MDYWSIKGNRWYSKIPIFITSRPSRSSYFPIVHRYGCSSIVIIRWGNILQKESSLRVSNSNISTDLSISVYQARFGDMAIPVYPSEILRYIMINIHFYPNCNSHRWVFTSWGDGPWKCGRPALWAMALGDPHESPLLFLKMGWCPLIHCSDPPWDLQRCPGRSSELWPGLEGSIRTKNHRFNIYEDRVFKPMILLEKISSTNGGFSTSEFYRKVNSDDGSIMVPAGQDPRCPQVSGGGLQTQGPIGFHLRSRSLGFGDRVNNPGKRFVWYSWYT